MSCRDPTGAVRCVSVGRLEASTRGRVVFVNTLFGCLATVSDWFSCRPLWRPAFLSRLVGRFEPVAFCPGYLRGLAFVGDYAVVTLSKPRHDPTFGGLALDDELARRGAAAQCGVQVVDLRTGAVAHWLRAEGMVTEAYDVVALPGVTRPMAFGFKTDEVRRTLAVDDDGGL